MRALSAALVATAVTAGLSVPTVVAGASSGTGRSGTAVCGSTGCDSVARVDLAGAAPARHRSRAQPACTYARLHVDPGLTVYRPDGTAIDASRPGVWYRADCPGQSARAVFVPRRAPAATVAGLREEARSHLDPLPPSIGLSPAGEQLVGLATWLWIDPDAWRPITSTATVDGLTVTVTAEPTSVDWAMGDGVTVTCDGPGTPWPAPSTDCSHTYLRSSAGQPDEAYAASATINYTVTWAAVGAPGGGSLGAQAATTGFGVRVAESQALEVSARALVLPPDAGASS